MFKICVILQLLKSLHIEAFIKESTFSVQVLTKIITVSRSLLKSKSS